MQSSPLPPWEITRRLLCTPVLDFRHVDPWHHSPSSLVTPPPAEGQCRPNDQSGQSVVNKNGPYLGDEPTVDASARFKPTLILSPFTAIVSYFSSSAVSEVMVRFCSPASWFGNVLASR
jgi:hypothetical protein